MRQAAYRGVRGSNVLTPAHSEYWAFGGGLDQVSPALTMPPGRCRDSLNFEPNIIGGYTRVKGYERKDGRPSPSAQTYQILNATITGAWSVGNTVTGATSGATGIIQAGTSTYFVLAKVTGAFIVGENIQIAAVTVAVSTSVNIPDGAPSSKLHAQYKALAANTYRNDILAPTGSGGVLGVWTYNDIDYCFRNNAGGTAAVMYKATAGGWVAIVFGEEIAFSNANTNVVDGVTLTEGAVTATVARVVLQTGTLQSGVNTGRLIITGRAGGNFAGGAATTSGGGTLTLGGAQTAITLLPGGKYEFVNANFGGASGTLRMYGVDGVNRGFEFDGTTFVPISTGMTADTPNYVSVHKNTLFYLFGASLQKSGAGLPYQWALIVGAGEFALGAIGTGMIVGPGNNTTSALLIACQNKMSVLYGSSVSDFNLVNYSTEFGAMAYSMRYLAEPMFLTNQGLATLSTTQKFGNFEHSSISELIRPFITQERVKTSYSCIVRNKNQYRIFFSDGFGVYVTINGDKLMGMMPVSLANAVSCASSVVLSDGTERIMFGSSNGMVYEMEKGTSFDGTAINAYLTLAYNNSKSPRLLKRYRGAALEVSGSGYAEFSLAYSLGYANSDIPSPLSQTIPAGLSSPQWDTGTWDVGVWDGLNLAPSEAKLEGTAENISMMIAMNSDYMDSITFNGAMLRYSPRREKR